MIELETLLSNKTNLNNPNDPYASREAARYDNPVASREFILDVLGQSGGPLSHRALCKKLELHDEENIEALRRRLLAMVRDGQLVANRKGAYGPVSKMDLVKGRIIANREGYGFLRPVDGGDDIYLTHRQMRKVFDGDEVIVRQGPRNFRGQIEGAIVEVLQHNTTQLAGQFVDDRGHCYVSPDNPKLHHDIMVDKDSTMGATHGQIVVIDLIQQPGRRQRPQGKVVEILGDHLAPGMEIDVAIRSYGIPHEWPEAVHKDTQSIVCEVKEKDTRQRVDLRHLPFVTIDGEDARDFDDAVYCETKRSGGWRLFVAIADVSHYVAPNSALDCEAQKRGNSVYFPNHVVPMLPEILSNGLCSLNPLVDRLCMVCEMTVSKAGRISGYRFYEAVMHSKARLTYTEVGKILSEQGRSRSKIRAEYKPLLSDIDELYSLFQCLHMARIKRGAIEFETTETRMEFDESRKIQRIVPVHRNDAHRLIEECMLAANVCSAKFLESHDIPALFRVHEPPKADKFELLQGFLAELGLSMPSREKALPTDYQALMEQAKGRPDVNLIQTVMLRSMNQAVYQSVNQGHFGLAYGAYTHFTSPIRRYPDLLVHRAIRSVIRSTRESPRVRRVDGAKPIKTAAIFPYTSVDMDAFGEQCSHTERRADEATRDVVSWLKCEFLQERVGEVFEGVISSVTGFGLFVELKELYVEGLIHITSLPQDYYHYSAAHHRLVGERSRKVFHLGQTLLVRVVRVNLDERKTDFELVEQAHKKRKKPAKKTPAENIEPKETVRSPRKRVVETLKATVTGAKKKSEKVKNNTKSKKTKKKKLLKKPKK